MAAEPPDVVLIFLKQAVPDQIEHLTEPGLGGKPQAALDVESQLFEGLETDGMADPMLLKLGERGGPEQFLLAAEMGSAGFRQHIAAGQGQILIPLAQGPLQRLGDRKDQLMVLVKDADADGKGVGPIQHSHRPPKFNEFYHNSPDYGRAGYGWEPCVTASTGVTDPRRCEGGHAGVAGNGGAHQPNRQRRSRGFAEPHPQIEQRGLADAFHQSAMARFGGGVRH